MRKITLILSLTFTFLAASLAFAHGHGHVMGTIKAVNADHIEVTTKDGKTVSVPLTATTKYFKGDQKATWTDVKVGGRVVVHLGAKGAVEEVRLPSGKTSSAPAHAGAPTPSGLRRVETRKVCMVTNQIFEKDQIPVVVQGRTYYGCCEGCKQTLAKNLAARTAVDPVSGKPVDKAAAVIGARPDGSTLYFENESNLKKYSSRPQG
jgi:YHS domain-containing protein